MKTKLIHIAILCLGLCFISTPASSQEQMREKRAQFEELRHTYINERLQLNAEEQKAFAQLQKERREKMRALRMNGAESTSEKRKEMKQAREDREISEEEAKRMLMARIDKEEARTKLNREYTEAMIDAISAKKTLEYKRLEREFKRELIHMVKDDRQRHRINEELRHKKPEKAESRPVEAK